MIHGLASTYRHHKCRCAECRAANTRLMIQGRRARTERFAADPTLAPHGSASTYNNWGCRCGLCTAAHVERCRDYKARCKGVS